MLVDVGLCLLNYSPSDSHRLWQLQGCNQCLPVDGRYLVDAEPCANQNQGRVKIIAVWFRYVHEAVLVYVWSISGEINPQLILVPTYKSPWKRQSTFSPRMCELQPDMYSLDAPSCCRRTKPFTGELATRCRSMLDELVQRIRCSRVVSKFGKDQPFIIRVVSPAPV